MGKSQIATLRNVVICGHATTYTSCYGEQTLPAVHVKSTWLYVQACSCFVQILHREKSNSKSMDSLPDRVVVLGNQFVRNKPCPLFQFSSNDVQLAAMQCTHNTLGFLAGRPKSLSGNVSMQFSIVSFQKL